MRVALPRVLLTAILFAGPVLAHGPAGGSQDATNQSGVQEVKDFPTLHPLVVHFPIVLLIFLPAALLLSRRPGTLYLAPVLTVCALVGVYLASKVFHPHTSNLSEPAQALLREHDRYADLTLYATIASLFLQAVWVLSLKRAQRISGWVFGTAFLVMMADAGFVAVAAHHGAELTHKFGVGVQGKFMKHH